MLYEIAHIENGQIVRGGIKAPLLKVGSWIKTNLEYTPNVTFFAVPANENAISEEEYEAEVNSGDDDSDFVWEKYDNRIKPFDTVIYLYDHTEEELERCLRSLDLQKLKELFKYNRIDRTTNLRKKSITEDELIRKIIEVSHSRAHRGDAFRT